MRCSLKIDFRDIDLTGVDWTPIGTCREGKDEKSRSKKADAGTPVEVEAFTGTFDGSSHTISNLTVDQPEGYVVRLFGCLRDAHIFNLTLDGGTVDGSKRISATSKTTDKNTASRKTQDLYLTTICRYLNWGKYAPMEYTCSTTILALSILVRVLIPANLV